LKDTLLSIVFLVVILLFSAFITSWFARTMYSRCTRCGTLNARRRDACRSCGNQLK
jgi:rRNA maturation endonuclease Nob1